MIYVILADGFEETEAIAPIDIMKRAGYDVKTVYIKDKEVKGAHGITVTADMPICEAEKEKTELLMLPGGPGHENLLNDSNVISLMKYAAENDKYIASICAAPSIPGRYGLLSGKKAVCFPGYEKYLSGAEISSDKAVIDGKMITAKGAGAAMEFGFLIVEALSGKKASDELKRVMQF